MANLQDRINKTIGILMNKKTKRSERIKRTSRLFSEAMRYLTRDTKDEILCGPKCTQCCYRMPYVRSRLEQDFLVDVLDDTLGHLGKRDLMARIASARSEWVENCEGIGVDPKHPAAALDVEIEWAGLGIRCPLLVTGKFFKNVNLCITYPRIPLDCRMSLKIKEVCTTPMAMPINPVDGLRADIAELCHKIDKKRLGDNYKGYRSLPLIEVLFKWATK